MDEKEGLVLWMIIKPLAAEGAEVGFVVDEGAELREALDVAFAVEPEVEITAFGVFLVEMIETALVEHVKIGIRKQFEAIGHRALNDGKGIDLSISFGDDGTVDRTRRVLAAGTMIFDGIAHSEELVMSEPLAQGLVRHDDLAGMDMMMFAIETQA